MSDVPPEFTIAGPKPKATKATTRACKADGCVILVVEHSGAICSICRDPIEHHGTPPWQERCLAGRQRMAAARYEAGAPLDDVDALALSWDAY